MTQASQDNLRTLFPHLDESQIAAAHERLRRYVDLAASVIRRESLTGEGLLTESSGGGSVNAGQVDPSTFKNTG
jgi:hypothetical protein